MKNAATRLSDLPAGYAVADVGDRYVAVYPGRPWVRIIKDSATTRKVRAIQLRLVKSDRRQKGA